MFVFDRDALLARAKEECMRAQFQAAEPYPHIVIDDLIDRATLVRVAQEFPSENDAEWIRFRHENSKKLALPQDWLIPSTTRHVLNQLNTGSFLDFVELVTGIDNLIPDPHFEGGGMHQIVSGGFLKIHADFNVHPNFGLDRRVNALVYLNVGWRDEWGGHLELWDSSMSRCVKKIAPEFNRCVIFTTTDKAFHGHPNPLRTPDGVTRKSLALYYYSNGRPDSERSASHSTLYQIRPGRDARPVVLRRLADGVARKIRGA
jgi:Rps23 Pro-64 3,4-dihydroxylase Tpa1-like proline 4-hydroxylase